jgi:hypothetical protein
VRLLDNAGSDGDADELQPEQPEAQDVDDHGLHAQAACTQQALLDQPGL